MHTKIHRDQIDLISVRLKKIIITFWRIHSCGTIPHFIYFSSPLFRSFTRASLSLDFLVTLSAFFSQNKILGQISRIQWIKFFFQRNSMLMWCRCRRCRCHCCWWSYTNFPMCVISTQNNFIFVCYCCCCSCCCWWWWWRWYCLLIASFRNECVIIGGCLFAYAWYHGVEAIKLLAGSGVHAFCLY